MTERHKDIVQRLRMVTVGCQRDMHEPDEQGVFARVLGTDLDNACGDRVDVDLLKFGSHEIVIVIDQFIPEYLGGYHVHEVFNLADLLAIVRGVDIDSDEQSELREMAKRTVGEDVSTIEGGDDE